MTRGIRSAILILVFVALLPYPVSAQGLLPVIYSLGPGCENWDCVWIVGTAFSDASRVEIVAPDWSVGETLYGPAWQMEPGIYVAPAGDGISFQITDPTLLFWFGGIGQPGIYARVVNDDGSASAWAWVQAPAPVITAGGTACDDLRCIWLTGVFPLNAWVDFRVPNQPDVLPGAYTSIEVQPDLITLRLDPSVWALLDTYGLSAWAVTGLFPSWSNGYNIPPPPRPAPAIYSQGSGCENWDCVWIYGAGFAQDARVEIVATDWSAGETLYGPAWQMAPGIYVAPEGDVITFQITDPVLLNWFGGAGKTGIFARVINGNVASPWVWIQAPAPVISAAGPGCDDLRCIWLTGAFPLNAWVDFRIPNQPDILPGAYPDIHVEPTVITLRLDPSVWPLFDLYGLKAWAVNRLFPNWSSGYTINAVNRPVVGFVDGVSSADTLVGWACLLHYSESIAVHVYVGGPAGGGGAFVLAGPANASSEPAVAEACQSTGTSYRFALQFPANISQTYAGQAIYVYGISPFEWLPNQPLQNSGLFTVPSIDRSVTGYIDTVTNQGQNYYLNGWACAKTYPDSIDVHVYAGGPAGAGGTYAFAGTANTASEPAVSAACNAPGTNYRFSLPIPLAVRQQYGGQAIYVHGISPFGLENLLISVSGVWIIPPAGALSSKEYIYLGGRLIAVDTNP